MAKDTKGKKEGGLLNRLRSARQQKMDPELKELLNEVQADPGNMRSRRKLADYYLKKNDNIAALDQYLTVAETYAEKGFYPKAVAVYKQALQIDPKMIEVYLKLAGLYHKLGLMPEVVQQYQKAAAVYEGQGKEREALDIRRMLLDLDPTNLVGRVKLGQRYLEKGLKQEAVNEFLQAADVLEQQGKTAELQKLLEGVIDRGLETFDLLYRLVQLYRAQGRPDLALARLAKLTGELAGSSSTLELTADLAVELGKPAIAVKALERVGELYGQINRTDKVAEIARRILTVDPHNAYALAHVAPAPVEAPPEAPPVEEKPIPIIPAAEEVEGEISIEEEIPIEYIAESSKHEEKPTVEARAAEEAPVEYIAEGTAHEAPEVEELPEEIIIEEEAPPVKEAPPEELSLEETPPEEIPVEIEEIPLEEVPIEEIPLEETTAEAAAEPFAEAPIAEAAAAEEPIEEISFEAEAAPAEEAEVAEEAFDLAAMSEDEAAQRLDEAIDIYLKYNLRDKAIEYLTLALQRNPRSMAVLEKMMVVYRDGGNAEKAGELLEQLVDLAQAQGRTDKLEQYLSLMVEQAPEDLVAAERLAAHFAETEPERAVVHYLDLANRYRELHQFADAEKTLERVLQLDPENEGAQHALLDIYEESGQTDRAVEKLYFLHGRAKDAGDMHGADGYLRRVLDLRPNEEPAQQALLDLYRHFGETEKQRELLRRLGDRALAAGEFDTARERYEQLLALEPGNLAILGKLKDVMLDLGRTDDAITQLFALADAAQQRDERAPAVDALREVLHLDANRLDARERLRDLYLNAGDHEHAIQEMLALAKSALDAGSIDSALQHLNDVLRIDPRHEQTIRRRVSLLRDAGRIGEAVDALQVMARDYQREERNDRAEAALREIIELQPQSRTAREALKDFFLHAGLTEQALGELLALADAAREAGDRDEALNYLGEACGLDPDSVRAHEGIVELQLADQRTTEAVSEMLALADIHRRRLDPDAAIDWLQRALRLETDNEVVLRRLVDLYVKTDQRNEAVELLLAAGDRAQAAARTDEALAYYARVVEMAPDRTVARERYKDLLIASHRTEEAIDQLFALADQYHTGGEALRVEEAYRKVLELDPDREQAAVALKDHYLSTGRTDAGLDMLFRFVTRARQAADRAQARQYAEEMLRVAEDDRRALVTLAELAEDMGDSVEAAQRYLHLAALDENESRADDAEASLAKVLEIDPDNIEAHERLKALLVARGEIAGAVAHVFALADLAVRERDAAQAEALYREVLDLDEDNEPALDHLVNLLVAEGEGARALPEMFRLAHLAEGKTDYAKAERSLRQILDVQPGDEAAIEQLSRVHIAAGDTGQAVSELFMLAKAAENKGDYDGTLRLLQRILDLDAENLSALSQRADLEEILGRPDQSVATLRTLAGVQRDRHLLEDAERSLRQAVKLAPEDHDAHEALLEVLTQAEAPRAIIDELLRFYAGAIKAGEHETITKVAQRILAVDEKFERAHRMLADSYRATGQAEQAVAELFTLSALAAEANRTADAEGTLKEVLELDATNALAANRLTDAYLASDRRDEAARLLLKFGDALTQATSAEAARDAYERVLDLDADNEDALRKLKESYLAGADLAEAVDVLFRLARIAAAKDEAPKITAALEEILDLDPRNEVAVDRLKERYLADGQPDQAIALLFAADEAIGAAWDDARRLENFGDVLAVDPGNERALRRIIELDLAAGRAEGAIDALWRLADIHAAAAQADALEKDLREVVRLDAGHVAARERLAKLYREANQTEALAAELFELARIHRAAGAHDAVQETLMDIVDLGGRTKERALHELAELYAARGDKTGQLQVRFQLAEAARDGGDMAGAVDTYQQILADDPDNLPAREALIALHEAAGRLNEAAAQAFWLAERARKEGAAASAVQRYEQALGYEPGNTKARKQLKKLLVEQGRTAEATTHLRALADQAREKAEYEAVEDALREILQHQPDSRDVHMELVELYEQSDQPDKAVVELLEMARLRSEAGERDDALRLIQRAAALQADNPVTLTELKAAYLGVGDKPQAVETLFRLFDVYVAARKRQSAEKSLREILAIDPNNATAKEKVIDLFRVSAPLEEQIAELLAEAEDALSSGERANAIAALNQVLELDPEQPEALARLRVVYAEPPAHAREEDQAEARVFEDVDVTPQGAATADEEINIDWGEPGELEQAVTREAGAEEQAVEVDVFEETPEQEVEEIDVFGDISGRRGPAKEAKAAAIEIEPEIEEEKPAASVEIEAEAEAEPEPAEEKRAFIEFEAEFKPEPVERVEPKTAFGSAEISSEDFLHEEIAATTVPPRGPARVEPTPSRIIEEFRKPEIEVIGKGVGVADLLDELQLEKPAPAEFKPTEAGDLLDEILGAKPQPKAEAGAATALDDLFAELETKAEAKSAGIQDEIFQSFVSHLDQETVTAKDAHTHFDLGIAFREMDSIEEALAEFEKALAMDTGDLTFDINYQLGQCYGSLNKPEMAIEYLETALAEGSENESVLWDLLFELGVAHKKLGNPERAKQYFVEVDKKSSNYRGAKTEIADLEKTKGKKGKKKGEPDDDNIGFL